MHNGQSQRSAEIENKKKNEYNSDEFTTPNRT